MGSGKNKQARASSILMNKEQVTKLRELEMDTRAIRQRKKRNFCSEEKNLKRALRAEARASEKKKRAHALRARAHRTSRAYVQAIVALVLPVNLIVILQKLL